MHQEPSRGCQLQFSVWVFKKIDEKRSSNFFRIFFRKAPPNIFILRPLFHLFSLFRRRFRVVSTKDISSTRHFVDLAYLTDTKWSLAACIVLLELALLANWLFDRLVEY